MPISLLADDLSIIFNLNGEGICSTYSVGRCLVMFTSSRFGRWQNRRVLVARTGNCIYLLSRSRRLDAGRHATREDLQPDYAWGTIKGGRGRSPMINAWHRIGATWNVLVRNGELGLGLGREGWLLAEPQGVPAPVADLFLEIDEIHEGGELAGGAELRRVRVLGEDGCGEVGQAAALRLPTRGIGRPREGSMRRTLGTKGCPPRRTQEAEAAARTPRSTSVSLMLGLLATTRATRFDAQRCKHDSPFGS